MKWKKSIICESIHGGREVITHLFFKNGRSSCLGNVICTALMITYWRKANKFNSQDRKVLSRYIHKHSCSHHSSFRTSSLFFPKSILLPMIWIPEPPIYSAVLIYHLTFSSPDPQHFFFYWFFPFCTNSLCSIIFPLLKILFQLCPSLLL